jgi:uncharacterized membrane protein YtjA (UPF0391 family)
MLIYLLIAGEINMLYWALVFFIISIIAGVFGFTGIAVASAAIAKIIFVLFLFLFLLLLAAIGLGKNNPDL